MKTDAQIQEDVLQELQWDPRVEATDVGVEVDDGVVTLTGTVSSYTKKLAAQEAAHTVGGVLDVANDLRVHVPGHLARTDTELAHAVRWALEWDVVVPHERIHATVRDGWVTLEGTVDFAHEREDAEHAVRRLVGVRGVANHLAIGGPARAAAHVRQAIEAALERRAEREAKRITVAVHDGTATLTGTVHSWAERRAVLGAARFTPGVLRVEDRLDLSLPD